MDGNKKILFFGMTSTFVLLVVFLFTVVIYAVVIVLNPLPRTGVQYKGDKPYEFDSETGIAARKSASLEMLQPNQGEGYFTVYTDDRGSRVDRPGIRHPGGTDVMVLGCSFSWGSGFENEKTYSSILARKSGLHVTNMAVNSFGTTTSYRTFTQNHDLNPKYVVYGFIADHLRRNLSPCAPSVVPICWNQIYVTFDEFKVPALKPVQNQPFKELYLDYVDEIAMTSRPGIRDIGWRFRLDLHSVLYGNEFEFENTAELRLKAFGALLRGMIQQADAIGAEFILMRIPDDLAENGNFATPEEVVVALKELPAEMREKVRYLDLEPAVQRHYRNNPGRSLRFQNDGHPNETMHAIMAEELLKEISR